MQFINPKTDYAFKKIFGSSESGDILLSFLNAILGLEEPWRLKEVRVQDPYLAPSIKGMKESFVDVRAIDEQERHFIIEMQILPVAGFEQRVLYNACKTYAGQIKKGEDYRLMNEVIALNITDFEMFPHSEVVSKFCMRDAGGREYSQDIELIFVELPKFSKDQQELASALDKWCYFLRHASGMQEIPPILAEEPAIQHAFGIANRAQLSPEELELQERREIFLQDLRGIREYAETRGLREGMQRGIQQGMEQGMQQGMEQGMQKGMEQGLAQGAAEGAKKQAREIAARLQAMGCDKQQILQATGLSLEEL